MLSRAFTTQQHKQAVTTTAAAAWVTGTSIEHKPVNPRSGT